MAKRLLTAGLLVLTVLSAQAETMGEGPLRAELQAATWPADIVRLADEYLARHPDGAYAEPAAAMRDRASDAMRALRRNEVQLFRSAFIAAADALPAKDDMRRAALADTDAAVRLAHLNRQIAAGEPHRYLGWLQYASALGNERASYELALHYRSAGQPVLAAKYETRAVERGYQPPTWLDNVRK